MKTSTLHLSTKDIAKPTTYIYCTVINTIIVISFIKLLKVS